MHGRTAWWGTSVKTIKQGWDDGICAVCVCAMATGSTTQDVYDFFGNDREYGEPITACEVAMFLMSRDKLAWLGLDQVIAKTRIRYESGKTARLHPHEQASLESGELVPALPFSVKHRGGQA